MALAVPQHSLFVPAHIARHKALEQGLPPPPTEGEKYAKSVFERLRDVKNFDRIVFGNRILVAKYIPETIQGSSLVASELTDRENEYQGKAMLVLAKGHLAFKSDKYNDFGDDNVEIGDWVYCEYSAGTNVDFMEPGKIGKAGRIACKIVRDTEILGVVPNPESVF